MKTPIKYNGQVDIRFADLDSYGHVNSKHYIDLVTTVRLNYLANTMATPIGSLTSRGLGFYLVKSTVHYRKPIDGLQRVHVSSHVAEVIGGRAFVVRFVISTVDESKVFADGILEFAVIDMNTQRSTTAPDWVLDLFFENS